MRPIFQVTGYKNSGKTTVIEDLSRFGKDSGDRVAVIKHHPHTDPLQPLAADNDSERIFNSGASVSSVISPRGIHIHTEEEILLEQMIQWYELYDPDLILIEGYKEKNYPKAVILKEEADQELLMLSNIQLVITWGNVDTSQISCPVIEMAHLHKDLPMIYSAAKEERE
ncbi:molybdopterin-guanine dinucleotide biosynthesis protein B [Halobacillus sp. Marseille-Q1614]|uniref:molybdopterin-guanine dinucleotide biosynthesis protein B n=1 Tax=Halobacillus sp. Marseille-Q1614 TaxID=2709134 RepID=UPI00156DF349|nr:molybdopterin-guanine dinucleotide biosynthesis protein B [Halobacillus sp. Marseille-Q1614]